MELSFWSNYKEARARKIPAGNLVKEKATIKRKRKKFQELYCTESKISFPGGVWRGRVNH